ncbi:MAG TPA: hypothetical protein VFO94_05510, partial [Gammaproteobacteria bacterium]|nr:hypothetical protein [Gammaproteobacteria bacterium]
MRARSQSRAFLAAARSRMMLVQSRTKAGNQGEPQMSDRRRHDTESSSAVAAPSRDTSARIDRRAFFRGAAALSASALGAAGA